MSPIKAIRETKLIEKFNKIRPNFNLSDYKEKKIYIESYASKKIEGCYATLKKPKIQYALMHKDETHVLVVNKVLFNYFKELPLNVESLKKQLNNQVESVKSDYERFNGKPEYSNYINRQSKLKDQIKAYDLWINNRFIECLELIKGGCCQ